MAAQPVRRLHSVQHAAAIGAAGNQQGDDPQDCTCDGPLQRSRVDALPLRADCEVDASLGQHAMRHDRDAPWLGASTRHAAATAAVAREACRVRGARLRVAHVRRAALCGAFDLLVAVSAAG